MRYGFCVEDDAGNIVSVWNFAELDEALRGIESSDDEEAVPENAGSAVESARLFLEPPDGLVPRYLASDPAFSNDASVGRNAGGVETDGDDVVAESGDIVVESDSVTPSHFHPLGDCVHGHPGRIAMQGLEEPEHGHIRIHYEPCPVCEFEYRQAIEEWYSDMPLLLPRFNFSALYPDMPDLESWDADEVSSSEVHPSQKWEFEGGHSIRISRTFNLCAKIILLELICVYIKFPAPVFVDTLDYLLRLCLILTG